MIKDYKVLNAHFTNHKETDVLVILEKEDGTSFFTTIRTGEQYPEYNQLLEVMTLDDIRKNTIAQADMERQAKLAEAKEIFDEDMAKLEENVLNKLFMIDGEGNPELNFKLKIIAFELDEIKALTAAEKKKIRQARNSLDTLKCIVKALDKK